MMNEMTIFVIDTTTYLLGRMSEDQILLLLLSPEDHDW